MEKGGECNHALMPHACGAEPRAHVFVFAVGVPAGLAEFDESLDVQDLCNSLFTNGCCATAAGYVVHALGVLMCQRLGLDSFFSSMRFCNRYGMWSRGCGFACSSPSAQSQQKRGFQMWDSGTKAERAVGGRRLG